LTAAETWDAIESWLIAKAEGVHELLRPGASLAAIENAQSVMQVRSGEELAYSYSRHDGHTYGLFPMGEWLSLTEMLSRWQLLSNLRADGMFDYSEAQGDIGVRSDWWNSKWVPFTDYGSGDYSCVDFDPDDGGTVGQIITFDHEDAPRMLVASSFAEFLESFAKDLLNGLYVYDDGEERLVPVSDLG
jgi:cell wall assembly regulator SMI1